MNSDASQFQDAANYPNEESVFAPLYDSVPFQAFDLVMDESLDRLIGRWIHLAAPQAATTRLRSFSPGHPKKAK